MFENKKELILSLIVFIVSFLFYFYGIENADVLVFDEEHFVVSASKYLKSDASYRIDHPPLGQYLIALGIKLFGYEPIGWRISAVFFGALTNVALFRISYLLFQTAFSAILSLILINGTHTLYVLSRVGMLEIFLIFFIFASFYFSLKFRLKEQDNKYIFISLMFWGFAISVKWYGVVFLVPLLYIYKSNLKDFIKALLIPVGIYISLQLSLLFFEKPDYTIIKLLKNHLSFFSLHLNANMKHAFTSKWWTWPFSLSPTWMYYKMHSQELARMITYLTNPLISWFGVLSVVYSSIRFFKYKDSTLGVLLLCYFSFFGFWILVNREQSFNYYYSIALIFKTIILMMTLEGLFQKKEIRAIAVLILVLPFIYFFPILGARDLPFDGYEKRIWFDSWQMFRK